MDDPTGQPLASATPGRLLSAAHAFFRRGLIWLRANPRTAQKRVAVVALVVIAALVWWASWPVILVVNTGTEAAVLGIDGVRARVLPPVSVETPGAGARIRLTPGRHAFELHSPSGEPLDARSASLRAATSYLYAPVTSGQCFWIAYTTYGAAHAPATPLRRLSPETKLWELPDDIDAWFAPNPEPDPRDTFSSGGVRIAVRQARCEGAPFLGSCPGAVRFSVRTMRELRYLRRDAAHRRGSAEKMTGLVHQILASVVFSLVGLVLFGVGFFVVKLVMPFSIRKEIEEDQNTSLGVILGAVIIGLSLIIAAAIKG